MPCAELPPIQLSRLRPSYGFAFRTTRDEALKFKRLQVDNRDGAILGNGDVRARAIGRYQDAKRAAVHIIR